MKVVFTVSVELLPFSLSASFEGGGKSGTNGGRCSTIQPNFCKYLAHSPLFFLGLVGDAIGSTITYARYLYLPPLPPYCGLLLLLLLDVFDASFVRRHGKFLIGDGATLRKM